MADAAIPPGAKPSRFRLKRPRPKDTHDPTDDFKHSSRGRFEDHHHHHGHRSKRHKSSHRSHTHHTGHASSGPSDEDAAPDADRTTSQAAFKESLFDALADDEGADYWQHVYGQPMHTYRREQAEAAYGGGAIGDDAFAAWVNQQMWQKSHEHILAERRRREREAAQRAADRRREREETRRMCSDEEDRFRRRVDASLRKRKRRREEEGVGGRRAWERYLRDWDAVREMRVGGTDADGGAEKEEGNASSRIPWPVDSGKARHVSKEAVEAFLAAALADLGPSSRATALRAERVRWHPDKIQHRFGGQTVDPETLKLVNTVFLTVDELYSKSKDHG
jgi:hypothetical protein